MGFCAEEARQFEYSMRERNLTEHGCEYPGTKYDDNYWEDAAGTLREICNMDSMHLCFVLKQFEVMESKSKNKSNWWYKRKQKMEYELERRGFTEDDFDFNIEGVKLGLYCFYPNESGSEIETYYKDIFSEYSRVYPPKFLMKKGDKKHAEKRVIQQIATED